MSDTIKGDNYTAQLDRASRTVLLRGSLRLMDIKEYAPVSALFDELLVDGPGGVCIDVRELSFLNSAGIQSLLRFMVKLRDLPQITCTLRASSAVPWHGKSLRNLKQLLPSLNLTFE